MVRGRLLVTLLTIPALALVACSDEEGLSDEEQEYADAFAITLANDDEGLGVEPDDAECMADALMTELGVEPFEEADVQPDDIEPDDQGSPGELLGDGAVSDDQAKAIVETWDEDCVDVVDVLVESAGSEFDLDPEGKECFAEGLGEGGLATRLLAASFTTSDGTPDEATMTEFLQMMEGCAGDGQSPVVDAMAESLAEDGTFTDEEAQCIAQGVLDIIGTERMSELFASGDFEELGVDAQNEIAGAMLQAAAGCGLSPSDFAE